MIHSVNASGGSSIPAGGGDIELQGADRESIPEAGVPTPEYAQYTFPGRRGTIRQNRNTAKLQFQGPSIMKLNICSCEQGVTLPEGDPDMRMSVDWCVTVQNS